MIEISSLYIHFPFCRRFCNYCDFFKWKETPSDSDVDSFEKWMNEAFMRHASFLESLDAKFAPLETLYIGGGTPSLWGQRGAVFLDNFLKQRGLSLEVNPEFTLEINPAACDEKTFHKWREVGANRFSVGIQTLDSSLLPLLGRAHTLGESHQLLSFLSKAGVNFSVDFLLGIPRPNGFKRSLLKEIQEALDYGPSHVSAYILTVGEDYVQSTLLPSEEEMAEEYLEASSFLQSRGYQAYEVSNFALPGKESRHNLKYWKNQSVAALGPSATGFILTEENGATRYKWEKRETVFEIEKLGTKELNLERLYLGLRTHEGIKPEDFFSAEENELFQGLAQTWVKCGLASWENHHIKATLRGMLVMDSLMDDIFRCVKTF